MQKAFFEALYKRVEDYFDRNRDWFNEYFFLIEIFDRVKKQFFYIETEQLFQNKTDEIEDVLQFFKSKKAKGSLKNQKHHTSKIYKKFNAKTLKSSDFKLKSLKQYFDKHLNPKDVFIFNKKRLLKLKISDYQSSIVHYFSFPLIGFNELQGSIHILFSSTNLLESKIQLKTIFKIAVVNFTEYYEMLFINLNLITKDLNFQSLSSRALENPFLRELAYPKFYKNRQLPNQNNFRQRVSKRVVILYHSKDEDHFIDFTNTLKPLERENRLNLWSTRRIELGQLLKQVIQDNLQKADIIIALISQDFIADDFCHEQLQEALLLNKTSTSHFIPILVSPSNYQYANLDKFQVLPRNKTPISKWISQSDAWVEISVELETLL